MAIEATGHVTTYLSLFLSQNITNTMVYEKVRSYAINAIENILPLEKEMCTEMVNYTLTLPNDQEIEDHFIGLLGHSDDSYKLITTFIQLKHEEDQQKQKKTTPVPESKEILKTAWSHDSPIPPKSSKQRLKGNRTSTTISELADAKPSNKLSGQQARKAKRKNLDNLKDIEAALHDLEVEDAENQLDLAQASAVRRSCNCMATRHSLFEVAPNCLNCGKIICSKEGLQPCSYCGKDLLSLREKVEIIRILQSERDLLETKQANPKNKIIQEQASRMKIKVSVSAGENLWKAQDEALKRIEAEKQRLHEIHEKESEKRKELEDQLKELEHYERAKEVNPDLVRAQERLETLLDYQDTGAERTRIIDNASDFDMPHQSSGSMWLSPVERALQLKKQQKQLRKIEEQESVSTGRYKKVVEMVIKDGKVTMVEKLVINHEVPEEEQEIEELQGVLKQEKLDQEVAMAKHSWDYEKEQDKWEKPVYFSLAVDGEVETDLGPIIPRVQFANTVGSDELVVALPS